MATNHLSKITKNRSAVDHLSETGGTVVNKTRKSRRRRARNSTTETKKKTLATSMDYRKEAQKNLSQISCSSAPLPSSSLTTLQCLTPTPLRTRSLLTTHTYHVQPEETNFHRYTEFSKYLETPPSEQWGSLVGNGFSTGLNSLWRQPRNTKQIVPPQYYTAEDACIFTDNWRHETETGIGGAMTTPHGTISLRLHSKIRVDMTIDRAVRVINFKNNIVLSLSDSGFASALLHPNGRMYQHGSRVEILAHDVHGNNKYAKMWYKGVSFTSEQCALVYLVDAAGTRTTTDSFSDMSQDFSVKVFYDQSKHGPACIQEAAGALSAGQYWLTDEGVENWIINNVRISQTPDGLVRIARNSNKYQLRTSPSNGTASLTTPFLHCTASLGQTSHLFVKRGERRMHYDCTSFIVRNAGHSAGFDNNQLKVF
ncbi:PREDICTED: uncharacterized protein LOC105366555 [Ceratosolen solmsi marchali]|uniref:Uncharacterized protein LOC105366555 n=1 Tax=Ceratosolen solmsi marchali TaxID=326594 RepID=A0AAJ6YSF2_9HYME|nr:PREDICTED: uncharacterized protein LOC105366555 [Ceratosolen solmsi marchali]